MFTGHSESILKFERVIFSQNKSSFFPVFFSRYVTSCYSLCYATSRSLKEHHRENFILVFFFFVLFLCGFFVCLFVLILFFTFCTIEKLVSVLALSGNQAEVGSPLNLTNIVKNKDLEK